MTLRDTLRAASQSVPYRSVLYRAAALTSGTILAQALTFGLSFVLARIYTPATFGAYSVFLALAATTATLSTAALDSAIVLARSSQDARRIASVSIALSLLVAVAACVVGLMLSTTVNGQLGSLELGVLLPLFVCAFGISQVFTHSNLRADRIKTIAAFKVGQSIVMGSVQLVSSIFPSIPGLIVGSVAGWGVVGLAGAVSHFRNTSARRDLTVRSIKTVIRRYWRFPRYVMPNLLIDNLSNQAPIFIVGMGISMAAAGHYGLALMILSAPAALVSQAASQAFLQQIGGQTKDFGAIMRLMSRIWLAMSFLGFVPFIALLSAGPQLFEIAFGPGWHAAGQIAQSLAPLIFVRFVSSPTSSIYLKLGMQREQWWFACAAMLYRTLSYASVGFGYDLTTAIVAHVVCESIAIMIYNLLAWRRLINLRILTRSLTK